MLTEGGGGVQEPLILADVICEQPLRAAYLAGTTGESLIFLDNRLRNRKTYVEWCKTLMGPICDKLGVEQGGINSDRLYKLANNAELRITQKSQLGVHLGPVDMASYMSGYQRLRGCRGCGGLCQINSKDIHQVST